MLLTKYLHINYSEKSISFPNIDLQSEDQLLITGRSGSGKTSFLNALGGLGHGQVLWQGLVYLESCFRAAGEL